MGSMEGKSKQLSCTYGHVKFASGGFVSGFAEGLNTGQQLGDKYGGKRKRNLFPDAPKAPDESDDRIEASGDTDV